MPFGAPVRRNHRPPRRPLELDLARGASAGLLAASASQDHVAVGPLAGAEALGGLAPGGDGVTPAAGFSLAAAVGVIHGVHGGAADLGATAEPAAAAGLAQGDAVVLGHRHGPHGGPAGEAGEAGVAR